MSPRARFDHLAPHEHVALIAPPDPAPDSDAKPKHPSRFEDRISPRWLRIDAAVKYSGINRSRLFRLIAEGAIKSACLKEHRAAKRGVRLVDRFSLDLHLETLCRPIEERLVTEANALLAQEQQLTEQQKVLIEKRRAVDQQLKKVRQRHAPDPT
jgi:hypothetical protein